MWQLTWMLGFLPDWFWTLLLIGGILSFVLSRFFMAYKLPMKIGGVVAIIISTWFLGAASNEEKWQQRVTELEAKLKESEEASKQINTQVVEKVVTKTKVVQGKAQKIIEFIDREVVKDKEVVKYIEMCPVPSAIIDAHNAAATLNKAAEGEKK